MVWCFPIHNYRNNQETVFFLKIETGVQESLKEFKTAEANFSKISHYPENFTFYVNVGKLESTSIQTHHFKYCNKIVLETVLLTF